MVGDSITVNKSVEDDEVQPALEIVQDKVYAPAMAPAATDAVASGVEAALKVISEVNPPAGALVQVHNPFPTTATLPPKAAETDPLHAVLFPPLVEMVGGAFTVNINDDEDGVQPAFEIVQVNV